MDLPEEVAAFLAQFDNIVSIGFISTPLTCIGAGGYANKLAFFYFSPFLVAAVLFFGFLLRTWRFERAFERLRREERPLCASRASTGDGEGSAARGSLLGKTMLSATPVATRFFFLVYPITTTVAFEAFPCYDFGSDGRFLISDVRPARGSNQPHRAQRTSRPIP